MVRKTYLTILAVLAVLAGLIILPRTAAAISLKQNSIVAGDTITVGDVFHGVADDRNTKVLGIAPQPGQEMTLNARTLLRIAIAMNLPWRPATSADHVTLKRAASIVDQSMIENAIRREMDKEAAQGKYRVTMPQKQQIALPPDVAPNVEITDFKYNSATGWFEALATSPTLASPIRTAKITGTIERLVDVPVLRASLKPGDIISDRDIDFIEIKESDRRADMVVSTEELVGQTPRRLLIAGRPMKEGDVEAPQIVARGDIVVMTFEAGGMTLTASGKALQNGAKGDLIRVINTNSNKTIEGFITASKEVAVRDF